MKDRIASIVLAIALATVSLAGHHSYAVVFDPSKKVVLTARLTKVDWRNPHIGLSLSATNERGGTDAWTIEGGPPRFFQVRSVGKGDFAESVGQQVTVEALPARDGSHLGALLKITLANGKTVTSAPGA
jgi:hypothetical protein